MKKILKYFIIFFFIFGTLTVFYISIFDIPILSNDNIKNKKNDYVYKTTGAFKYNGSYYSSVKLTYRELFFKQGLLTNSNIKEFNLEELAPTNIDIYVPFENLNINWSKLENEKELEIRGVNKKYAKIIIDFKKKNTKQNLTWNDILKISGIGIKTVEKLKTFLILEQ